MSIFIVDVESDATSPASGSMVCFGAVKVTKELNETFYGQTAPISKKFNPQALSISGFSREEHEEFQDPVVTMSAFAKWINKVNEGNGRPIFFTDNLAFDWQWINYYFDYAGIKNPFGFSGRRINDVYSGLMKDLRKSNEWKKYRVTKHTHNPVDDAKGNAEALMKFNELGMRIKF